MMLRDCLCKLYSSDIKESMQALVMLRNSLPMQYFKTNYNGGNSDRMSSKFVNFQYGVVDFDSDCKFMLKLFQNYLIFGSDSVSLYNMHSGELKMLINSSIFSVKTDWAFMKKIYPNGYDYKKEKSLCRHLRNQPQFIDFDVVMRELTGYDNAIDRVYWFISHTGIFDLVFGYLSSHICSALCQYIMYQTVTNTRMLEQEFSSYVRWFSNIKGSFTTEVMISNLSFEAKCYAVANECLTICSADNCKAGRSNTVSSELRRLHAIIGASNRKPAKGVAQFDEYEIDKYGLSQRARNGLLRSKCYSRSDVVNLYNQGKMDTIRNIGDKTINEIYEKLGLGNLNSFVSDSIVYPFISCVEVGLLEFISKGDWKVCTRVIRMMNEKEFVNFSKFLELSEARNDDIRVATYMRSMTDTEIRSKINCKGYSYEAMRQRLWKHIEDWVVCDGKDINSYVFNRIDRIRVRNCGVSFYHQFVSPKFRQAVENKSVRMGLGVYERLLGIINSGLTVCYPERDTVKRRHINDLSINECRAYQRGSLSFSDFYSHNYNNISLYESFVGTGVDNELIKKWVKCDGVSFESYNLSDSVAGVLRSCGIYNMLDFIRLKGKVRMVVSRDDYKRLCDLFGVE